MTLWAFGDSFIAPDFGPHEYLWPKAIAKKLETPLNNLGKGATALEYTYHQFELNCEKFQQEDIVLIALTGLNRYFFFLDRPMLSNPQMAFHFKENICQEEIRAFEQFKKWLDVSDHNHKNNLINFLYHVSDKTKVNNLKTIIFFSFENEDADSLVKRFPSMYFVPGNLCEISRMECDTDEIFDLFSKEDVRGNHLIRRNHQVLTEKIVNHIENNCPIDLSEGFSKKVITKQTYNDHSFRQIEFFCHPPKFR